MHPVLEVLELRQCMYLWMAYFEEKEEISKRARLPSPDCLPNAAFRWTTQYSQGTVSDRTGATRSAMLREEGRNTRRREEILSQNSRSILIHLSVKLFLSTFSFSVLGGKDLMMLSWLLEKSLFSNK